MPTYEEGEASFNVTSDHSENQNPTEYNHPQTFEEGEYGARMASNFIDNEPEVINSTNNKQCFFLQVISYVIRIYQQLVFLLQEDTYQLQAQLDSFRGYDEGCYSLNALFPYGNMY